MRNSPRPRRADLTTVVLTRHRQALFARALSSLADQTGVALNVLVIIDNCPLTLGYTTGLASAFGAIRSLRWIYVERDPEDESGPVRIARLRETALQAVDTTWVAFLDDDNLLAPNHYITLLDCVEASGAPAAHSWRSLWDLQGRPVPLSDRHPWCRIAELARNLFIQYETAGIYQRHSHVVRDQVVPYQRPSSMVDTSEWLFRKTFLQQFKFCLDYSFEDWEQARAEDSKLLDQIVASGIAIPSTKRPTLKYFMGGYSNNPVAEAAALKGWLR